MRAVMFITSNTACLFRQIAHVSARSRRISDDRKAATTVVSCGHSGLDVLFSTVLLFALNWAGSISLLVWPLTIAVGDIRAAAHRRAPSETPSKTI
jgi:hypothetical protein